MQNSRPVCILLFIVCMLYTNICLAYSAKEIADKYLPSVVQVISYDKNDVKLGIGSGFVIDDELIATCYHVIAKGATAQIKTSEGISYPVTSIFAFDKGKDIAILRVKHLTGLTSFPIGKSNEAKPGEKIVVIGNPLGLEGSVTEGVLSQLRNMPPYGDTIQTSCPVSPGNSGGPMVNEQGEVVGIVSFCMTDGQNLNFGIASDTLTDIIKSAKDLGLSLSQINIDDNNQQLDDNFGIMEPQKGIIEVKVPSSGPRTIAPFIGLKYIQGTMKVYNGKPLDKNEVILVQDEKLLSGNKYMLLPDNVLEFGKSLAKKELTITFQYAPLRAAFYIPNNNAPRTNVPEVVNDKLVDLGYVVIRGAAVDAAIASLNPKDTNFSRLLAQKLNCAEIFIINVDTQTEDGYKRVDVRTTVSVVKYDLRTDEILLNKSYSNEGWVGNLRAAFAGIASLNRLMVRDCLDSILGTTLIVREK